MRILLIALLLVGCSDDRKCVRWGTTPVTTYVKVGNVLVPVVNQMRVCTEYAK